MSAATDALAAAIARGLADDATADARAAGLLACRAAMATLEPAPSSEPASVPIGVPPVPGDHVGQMLDLLIERLGRLPTRRQRSARAAPPTPPAAAPRNASTAPPAPRAAAPIPFVPIARGRR